MTLSEIVELHPDVEFLKADGFDECVIGFDVAKFRLVYDAGKIIEQMVNDGMDEDDAYEFFEYNISGAYVGEQTPIYVRL